MGPLAGLEIQIFSAEKDDVSIIHLFRLDTLRKLRSGRRIKAWLL
jgi:hypothetical protein